ncbi:prepilin-type N-terminal cleavage/methylation domain-containing protein [Bradyrhizobium genosp. P]|uniref:prepilin-type N-terminal cleavage/methylation domain-containing protein n=1 Tax=Bradyrhizobium genosp. P TaxID=83641 RepID=UPI003CEA147A
MSYRRKRSSDGERGFTLIETLVALAIIAAVLAPIGAVIATTVQGTRVIDQKLSLSGAAETVLAGLPGRSALKPGQQSGALAGHRWRIDVAPINAAAPDAPPSRFVPLAINMRMQGPGGAQIQVTTVRLVPNVAAEPGPKAAEPGPKAAE